VRRRGLPFDEAAFVNVLSRNPGIPVLAGDQEFEPITVPPSDSSVAGALGDLVRTLATRMTRFDNTAVNDPQLGVRIWGGFELPLTDRKAAIAAKLTMLEQLEREHNQARDALENAAKRVEKAQDVIDAVAATNELAEAEEEHTLVKARIAELGEQYTTSEEIAGNLRDAAKRSEEAFNTHDARLKSLRQDIDDLKHKVPGRGSITLELSGAQDQLERQER